MKNYRLSLIVLLLAFLSIVPAARAQDDVGDIFGRINALRASLGLPGYSINSALAAAAQQQAQWIVESGSVSHTRPDGSGPRSRANANGYPSTQVSENIYGGGMATADIAWSFWVNSGIHYAGMTNRSYRDVGIGVATGAWGTAYVAVFGDPGGPPPFVPQTADSGSGGGASAAPVAPSYVVGQDDFGNIMHEVQPGDTLGDIALIYGYTWDDLPYMMQLNGISTVTDLEIGSVFLVPPHSGTFTPAPGSAADPTDPAPTTFIDAPTFTPVPNTAVPTATLLHIATAAEVPDALLPAEQTAEPVAIPIIVAVPTLPDGTPGVLDKPMITRSGTSPWLVVAVVVQVGIVLGAGIEFFRRARRK